MRDGVDECRFGAAELTRPGCSVALDSKSIVQRQSV